MNFLKKILLVAAFSSPLLLAAQTNGSETVARHGMVASVQSAGHRGGCEYAQVRRQRRGCRVAVGLDARRRGQPNSGIGGGCFMLIHLADGRNIAIDGREMAPAAATRDMFLRHGKGDTQPQPNRPAGQRRARRTGDL